MRQPEARQMRSVRRERVPWARQMARRSAFRICVTMRVRAAVFGRKYETSSENFSRSRSVFATYLKD